MPAATPYTTHERALKHLRLPGAEVSFWPAFVAADEAAAGAAALRDELAWRDDELVMFGRRVAQPRRTAWIAVDGIAYTYSGLTMTPDPWHAVLKALHERLQRSLHTRFNSVLANLYRDGADHLGWHSDNERELGEQPVIASLSLGATRTFDLRHRGYRDNGLPVQRFELHSGDLLVMRGDTQRHWQHRVPKRQSERGWRINLSFRDTQPR